METAPAPKPTSPTSTFEYACFLSHYQLTGQRQCLLLREALAYLGVRAWLDKDEDNLEPATMRLGIERSAAYVLFLSAGVLTRPMVRMEAATALALGRAIVLVLEAGGAAGTSIDAERERARAAIKKEALESPASTEGLRRLSEEELGVLLPPGCAAIPFARGSALLRDTAPAVLAAALKAGARASAAPLVPRFELRRAKLHRVRPGRGGAGGGSASGDGGCAGGAACGAAACAQMHDEVVHVLFVGAPEVADQAHFLALAAQTRTPWVSPPGVPPRVEAPRQPAGASRGGSVKAAAAAAVAAAAAAAALPQPTLLVRHLLLEDEAFLEAELPLSPSCATPEPPLAAGFAGALASIAAQPPPPAAPPPPQPGAGGGGGAAEEAEQQQQQQRAHAAFSAAAEAIPATLLALDAALCATTPPPSVAPSVAAAERAGATAAQGARVLCVMLSKGVWGSGVVRGAVRSALARGASIALCWEKETTRGGVPDFAEFFETLPKDCAGALASNAIVFEADLSKREGDMLKRFLACVGAYDPEKAVEHVEEGARFLVAAARAKPRDSAFVERTLLDLSALCRMSASAREAVFDAGALGVVDDALQAHGGRCVGVAIAGCGALGELGTLSPGVLASLREANVGSSILALARTQVGMGLALGNGALTVLTSANDADGAAARERARKELLEGRTNLEGGIMGLVKTSREAFCNMTAVSTGRRHRIVFGEGRGGGGGGGTGAGASSALPSRSLAALFAALEAHAGEEDVAIAALGAVERLAEGGDERVKAAVAAPALPALLPLLARCCKAPGAPAVALAALRALAALLLGGGGAERGAFAAQGGAEALGALLAAFGASAPAPLIEATGACGAMAESGAFVAVADAACALLARLAEAGGELRGALLRAAREALASHVAALEALPGVPLPPQEAPSRGALAQQRWLAGDAGGRLAAARSALRLVRAEAEGAVSAAMAKAEARVLDAKAAAKAGVAQVFKYFDVRR
jgi:hypothetical protein